MPYISRPFLDLLDLADVSPERVNAVIDRRLARGDDTRMRPNEYYPTLLRKVTGVPVVAISRRSMHLLMSIESNKPFWHYHERNRNRCTLVLAADIPSTLHAALIGRGSGQLAATSSCLGQIPITGFIDDDPCGTNALLRPAWLRF